MPVALIGLYFIYTMQMLDFLEKSELSKYFYIRYIQIYQSINQSINQSIKTNLYSATCYIFIHVHS